jgi:hypothetical protein
MRPLTKAELVAEIAAALDVPAPPMSTGSTEPKEIFLLASDLLGLDLPYRTAKPQLARRIAESAGVPWTVACESRGSTVTAEGLQRVLVAVRYLTAR